MKAEVPIYGYGFGVGLTKQNTNWAERGVEGLPCLASRFAGHGSSSGGAVFDVRNNGASVTVVRIDAQNALSKGAEPRLLNEHASHQHDPIRENESLWISIWPMA